MTERKTSSLDRQQNQLRNPTVNSLKARPNLFAPGERTVTERRGEVTIRTTRKSLLKLMTFLRDDTNMRYKTLVDVASVDYPTREPRFEVVYMRLSVHYNTRCRVKVRTDERTRVPSLTGLYQSADWMEREVWDMFGIGFEGHPDRRRILTDYGFEGYPLRKDFPLSGYTEVRYDEAEKRVVCEPLERMQEYRAFDFRSAWKYRPDSQVVKG